MRHNSGFTLVEVIITATIFAIVMTLLGVFAASGVRAWNQNRDQVEAQETARTALARITKIVREAQPSNNGSYPIAVAAAQSLTFYANTDTDIDREQVHIFLQGTNLMLGTIQPVGEPASYPAGNEAVTTLATGIRNGASAIFQYFDTSYTGSEPALTFPVALQDVRLVHISLVIDADSNQLPLPVTLETSISFRNLKDNL
jgi:prepilin-type N-terminal cleavage/methylation domain-containing protein